MGRRLTAETKGVMAIVPTPFRDNGEVHVGDIGRLAAYYAECGIDGMTILGVMGEASKLSAVESRLVVTEFLAAARDSLPVVVGVSGGNFAETVDLALFAADAGAEGVMLQPMPGLKGDAAVVGFFELFVEKTKGAIPVCVQDYPQSSGVDITPDAWKRISHLGPVFMLKHEPPVGLQKLSAIRAAEAVGAARRVSILTSNNALYLPQELARGADGAMVGVAFSDLVLAVCRTFWAGDVERAGDIYDALLPIARYEAQGPYGLAARKQLLRDRGALSGATLRYPAAALSAYDVAELRGLVRRLERRLAELGLAIAAPLLRAA